jgi:hypothetical protein
MSAKILEKLFGSAAQVKAMKLFLFNPDKGFDKAEVIKKLRASEPTVRKELKLLESVGMIKKSKATKKKKVTYSLNLNFPYLSHLKGLLINTTPLQQDDITKKINKACRPKLVVVSGIFIQANDMDLAPSDNKIDLLIVGDAMKNQNLKSVVAQIESEIGQEIRYSLFNTDDFVYRMNLYDHLVRDIFDYPHQILLDKIGLN